MKVVSVGWMGAKIDFKGCTFTERENGSLSILDHDGAQRAVFPAGKWDGAMYEDLPDVQAVTLEEQLKAENKAKESIAFAASEGVQ